MLNIQWYLVEVQLDSFAVKRADGDRCRVRLRHLALFNQTKFIRHEKKVQSHETNWT